MCHPLRRHRNYDNKKNVYDANVKDYYLAQQDIFGQSQTDQTQSDGTTYSLIKQITDLSGQILVANEKNKYLNMTELTGAQFSFEALKEQNNSLNNINCQPKEKSDAYYQALCTHKQHVVDYLWYLFAGIGKYFVWYQCDVLAHDENSDCGCVCSFSLLFHSYSTNH